MVEKKAQKTNKQQPNKRKPKPSDWIVGIVGSAIFIFVILFFYGFISFDSGPALKPPVVKVINTGVTEGVDGAFAIDNSSWDNLLITTGLEYKSNKKTTVTVDGVEADLCGEYDDCDFKINFNKIGGNKTEHPYRIIAKNDKGEDEAILRIVQRESTTRNSYSTEDTKKHVAHIVCQNHIKEYFYPSSVKIHSIMGVGRDYEYGESWVYGVDVTVKSSAGGEIMYKATCSVAKWQNLEAGPYNGATGSIISFKVEPY